MQRNGKNYRLVVEETFPCATADYRAVEAFVAALEPQKNTDIVPAHVNTAEAETHKAAQMHFSSGNIKVTKDGLVITGSAGEGGYEVGKATLGKFSYAYGYLEVEATLPAFQKGVWPVFAVEADEDEEFRIVFDEIAVQGDMGKNACNLSLSFYNKRYDHVVNHNFLGGKTGNGFPRFYPDIASEEKLPEGRHVFGFEWDRKFATFSVDGTEYCKIDISDRAFLIYSQPILCHPVVTLSIGAAQIEGPDETLALPTSFTIHSYRLYQDEEGMLVRH